MLSAPFTQEQIDSINGYQQSGMMHPFTCGHCRAELFATAEGMRCVCGNWEQGWAWGWMTDYSWQRLFPFTEGE